MFNWWKVWQHLPRIKLFITQKELKTALEAGKQVYIFIDAPVYHEHDFYLDNKDVNNTKFRHANNIKIHEFIEEINLLNQGNIIFPFNTTSEIIKILQEQWAGLFQRLLIESSNSSHINMISELKQSLQAASQNHRIPFMPKDIGQHSHRAHHIN